VISGKPRAAHFAPGKHLGAYGAAGACTTQDAALAERIHKLATNGQARERYYGFELDRRDALAAHLLAQGIGCTAPYSPPMHVQPVYQGLGYAAGSLPRTERSGNRLLGLPLGPHLSLDQIDIVPEEVRARLA
jgi:dTDP-4-amino-4,6-dideoxygalactose transaminase